jgi:hypothetical protein
VGFEAILASQPHPMLLDRIPRTASRYVQYERWLFQKSKMLLKLAFD